MRTLTIVMLVSLVIGCSKKTELEEGPKLKEGWDTETYAAFVDLCKEKLPAKLKQPSNTAAVCECFTHESAVAYTPEDLDKDTDQALVTNLSNILKACAKKSGEMLGARSAIDVRNFLREPLAEPKKKAGKAFGAALDEAKPTHLDEDKGGLLDLRRPPGPAPEGDLLGDLPKKGEIFTKLKYTTDKKERNVVFKKITCTLDKAVPSSIIVELTDSRTKETLTVTLDGFDGTVQHYSSTKHRLRVSHQFQSEEKQVTADLDGKEKGAKSEFQLMNLKIEDGKLTGKINLKNAASSTVPPYSFLFDVEGDISCPVKEIDTTGSSS